MSRNDKQGGYIDLCVLTGPLPGGRGVFIHMKSQEQVVTVAVTLVLTSECSHLSENFGSNVLYCFQTK